MSTQPFPLSILCDVSVSVSGQGVAVPTFNQGLIIGNSGRIPSQGAGSRCVLFTSVADMINYGFLANDPETLAAGLYFAQDPAPVYLWVGCEDPTAIGTEALDSGHGGTGYVLNEIFLITQGGASGGLGIVTGETAGVVTSAAIIPGMQGTGYAIANGLATVSQSGAGVGLEVNITAIGETPLEAVTACRLAQPAWYLVMCTNAVDADHIAIAQFAQTAIPQMQYVYGTASNSALTGATGNVFSVIKAAKYSRAHGAYSTTQGGGAPNNAYIAAAIMGVAMGLNTGFANSNFTLNGKTLVGILPENNAPGTLTFAQFSVFAGVPGQNTGNNGNAYVNFANSYTNYEQGINGDGSWFDQILVLDMLAADAQISVLNGQKSLPSIPLDDAGQTLVLGWASGACARSANRGSLAGGTWTGPTVLNVTNGTSLPNGYLAQSQSFSQQSSGDRALRKGMPVYLTVILADSQQSFTIGINVQE